MSSLWFPGAWRQNVMRFDRTPQEAGKVPYTLTPATRDQAARVIDFFELTGRSPLSVSTIRRLLADPRALLGE